MGICYSDKEKKKQLGDNSYSNTSNQTFPPQNIEKQGFYSERLNQTTKLNTHPNLTRKLSSYQRGEKFYMRKKEKNADQMKNEENNLKQLIELFITFTDVTYTNKFYMVKLSLCNNKNEKKFELLGQTDSLCGNPIIYGESFVIDYFFEKEQILFCQIFQENTCVNQFNITIGQIMGSRLKSVSTPVKINNDIVLGNIVIQARAQPNSSQETMSIFNFHILVNRIYFQNGLNLFYVISHINDGKTWRPSYQSTEFDVLPNNQTFLNTISIETGAVINSNNENQNIKIDLFNSITKELLGTGLFQISQLKNNSSQNLLTQVSIFSTNNQGQIGKFYISYQQKPMMTFKDYLMKGMEINLEIAIDFTCSNESPDRPISLHYAYGNSPNSYEIAIKSCGSIVGYYDYDQLFPLYGFGGRPPNQPKVSHCFNLTFTDDPNVQGLDEIMKTYKSSLFKIKFDGPTLFAPVITKVMSEIKKEMDSGVTNHYYILMILTDGMINDMDKTCDIIWEAAYYPLSIIIIGIGNADFKNMETLDGDTVLLTNSKGEVTKRDLVQFVQFNKYKNRIEVEGVINELAEEVLKEVPRQVEEYFELTGRTI